MKSLKRNAMLTILTLSLLSVPALAGPDPVFQWSFSNPNGTSYGSITHLTDGNIDCSIAGQQVADQTSEFSYELEQVDDGTLSDLEIVENADGTFHWEHNGESGPARRRIYRPGQVIDTSGVVESGVGFND